MHTALSLLTPKDSHIIIFSWYSDVEAETFRLTELPFLVFRERLEIRRSVSTNPFEASNIDLGTSLPRTRITHMSSLQ